MKTNQVLVRQMGDFEVLQRTSDGMFNATVLLKQWNKSNHQKKQMSHYSDNANTEEFIKALITEEGLSKRNSVIMKSKANKGKNAGTWMHPLLFIDFAMWINPSFKLKVIKFVSDQLIKFRSEAGDAYREMCSQIERIKGNIPSRDAMSSVSKTVNIVVYGKHETSIRNKVGEEAKARDLLELEKDVTKLIRKGFIRNLSQLREYLLSEYRDRHEPHFLIPAK